MVRKAKWSKENRAQVQCGLIFQAAIELEQQKKSSLQKHEGETLLEKFYAQLPLVKLEDCVGAENKSLEDCQIELRFASGSLADGNGRLFTDTTIKKKSNKVNKVLRNCIHPAFCRGTTANLFGDCGTSLEDKIKLLKKEVWDSYAKPTASVTIEEEQEAAPAEEDEAVQSSPKKSPVLSPAPEPAGEAPAAEEQPVADTDGSKPAAFMVMPANWSGPFELYTWLKLGPWGLCEANFLAQMARGLSADERPDHLKAARPKKRQREAAEPQPASSKVTVKSEQHGAEEQLKGLSTEVKTPDADAGGGVPGAELHARARYRQQRIAEMTQVVELQKMLGLDFKADALVLLQYLQIVDPILEKAYGNNGNIKSIPDLRLD